MRWMRGERQKLETQWEGENEEAKLLREPQVKGNSGLRAYTDEPQ